MNRQRALIATLPLFLLAPILLAADATSQEVDRPRARDLGVEVGIFPPGPWNAITDVEGVLDGQVTVIEGARVNTGPRVGGIGDADPPDLHAVCLEGR